MVDFNWYSYAMYFQAFRHLVRNLKGGINSDWQKNKDIPQSHWIEKLPSTRVEKLHNIFSHTFRAKGESMCHVYPVEDCLKWLQGNLFKLPYT